MTLVEPIRVRSQLFTEPTGRPGDWWEPVRDCAASVVLSLRADAERRRLSVDLLATLLIERAVIYDDMTSCVINSPPGCFLHEPDLGHEVALGPGNLNTRYVRMLRAGDVSFDLESEAELRRRELLLPLRLHHAAAALTLSDTFECTNAAAVDEALYWEITAATAGQFMREWALRTLLATR